MENKIYRYLVEVKNGKQYEYYGIGDKLIDVHDDCTAWYIKEYGFKSISGCKKAVERLKKYYDKFGFVYESMSVKKQVILFKKDIQNVTNMR